MSPNDIHFLKSLGIKPEEIEPAAVPCSLGGYKAVYEPCPLCAGKRHRFLDDGKVFCLSCDARKQREKRYEQALERANEQDRRFQRVSVPYRGYEIVHLDGQGWCYRRQDPPFCAWHKADSFNNARYLINMMVGPSRYEPELDHADFTVGENECRGCGAPCFHRTWCRSCADDKFGDGR